MKRLLQGATALAALAATTPAFAEEGWYGRIDLGYSFDGTGELSGAPIPDILVDVDPVTGDQFFADGFDTLNSDRDLDNDWLQSIGVGYGFPGTGFRLEGEIAHRYNETDDDNLDDFIFDDAFGGFGAKFHVWSYMINAYYDFNREGQWMPYVGAGIGGANVNVSTSSLVLVADDGNDIFNTATSRLSDDGWAFAWQLMAGIGFRATEQLTIDVGYRYHNADGAEVDGIIHGTDTGFVDQFGDPIFFPQTFYSQDADYDQSAVTVGLRWQFTAPEPPPPPYTPPPPPPPPPPPAACPTQDFVVYFEWDRSNLNKDAEALIDDAIAQARACNLGEVLVVGHADTSGSAEYNVGLSERRASVVRDALMSRGVPAEAIRTEARGETDLARPTPDGVREPLNRRTAVTISFR